MEDAQSAVPADGLAAWLRLATLNVSARVKRRLLERFGSPEALFSAGPAAWALADLELGLQARLATAVDHDVEAIIARMDRLGVQWVPWGDSRYPTALAAIDDPPPVLFVRGRLPAPDQPCVALVGTRRGSPYGEVVAETLGRELAAVGVAVISGLATGIDAAAHRGALLGGGLTLGVLGCGVDVVYPRDNEKLFDRLAVDGGIVSEFVLGQRPDKWHFPARNRIIAGLSQAVVVVEAPERSGALITARLAMEQNREVLAVPGQVSDTRSSGCHALLRDGAALVRDVDDVLEAINLTRQPRLPGVQDVPTLPGPGPVGPPPPPATPRSLPDLTEPESQVVSTLSLDPLAIDDIIGATGLTTAAVQSALVTLELKGVARRLPGNRFVRQT